MRISISNFIRRVYHGSVGELGTTMILVATFKTILCNSLPITAKGGMHRRVYLAMIFKKSINMHSLWARMVRDKHW